MASTPKPSAKLIIWGLLLSAVIGPILAGIGASMAAAAMYAAMPEGTFEPGMMPDPEVGGPGGILILLGMLAVLVGAVMSIIGLYNLLSTFDALGQKYLGGPYGGAPVRSAGAPGASGASGGQGTAPAP